jgi:hypothetical protein
MIPLFPSGSSFRQLVFTFAASCVAAASVASAQTVGGAQPSTTEAQVAPSGPAAAAPASDPAPATPSGPVVEKAENPLAKRSATSNVVFGQIVDVQDKRLNIRDGKTLTGLDLTPRTVVTINGEPGTLAGLRALGTDSRVQVVRDPKNPSRVLRIAFGEQPAVGAGGAGTATSATGDNNTVGQAVGKPPVANPNAAGSRNNTNQTAPAAPATKPVGPGVGASTPRSRAPASPNAVRRNTQTPSANRRNVQTSPNAGARQNPAPAATSRRPLAPGQNANDQPLAPFTRGPEQPLAPGSRDSRPLAPGTSGTTGTTNLGSLAVDGAVPFTDLGFGLVVGTDGVSVGAVIPTGIAGAAGFLRGDIVTSIHGQAVGTPAEVQQVLSGFGPGDHLTVEVMRNGSAERLTMTLPEDFDPKAPRTTTETEPSLADVDTRMFSAVDLGWELKDSKEGPLVLMVHPNGAAHAGNLKAGDIITTIDDHVVSTPGAVSYELHRHPGGTAVNIGILRDGERTSERVTLPDTHQAQLLEGDAAAAQQTADLDALREEIQQLRQEIQELRASRK